MRTVTDRPHGDEQRPARHSGNDADTSAQTGSQLTSRVVDGVRRLNSARRAVGGSLEVESTPGYGTAVSVAIPLPEETEGGVRLETTQCEESDREGI